MGNPDRRLVDALILKARRRGPDSFGIAWRTTRHGQQAIERQLTPSWPAPYRVTLPSEDLAWGIGHARLTTSGRGIYNAQPLQIGDLIFAHNGTVYEPEVLAAVYGLPLVGELYHFLANTKGHASGGLAKAAYSADELLGQTFRFGRKEYECLRTHRVNLMAQAEAQGQ